MKDSGQGSAREVNLTTDRALRVYVYGLSNMLKDHVMYRD